MFQGGDLVCNSHYPTDKISIDIARRNLILITITIFVTFQELSITLARL